MRKITVKFNKLKDIQNLKKIMKTVYASNSDHLPDIAKFNLGKIFAPSQVDRAEVQVETSNGTDIITISRESLSFFVGDQHPFSKVVVTSDDEAQYIVLPWNLTSRIGRDNLKNLINRIPSNSKTIKYIIYINSQSNSLNNISSLNSNNDLSQSLTSLASLHLSDIMAEDETESLLNTIDNLEQSVNQKQLQINSLTTQVANLQTQAQTQRYNTTGQSWTLALPNSINGGINTPSCSLSIGPTITVTAWKTYASVNNVAGDVTLDIANRVLTIGGSSCGSVNAY
jgi:hypothetical protein